MDAGGVAGSATSYPTQMLERTAYTDARDAAVDGRRSGICGGILIGLAVLALIRAVEASAADQATIAVPGKLELSEFPVPGKLEQSEFLPSTLPSTALSAVPGTYSVPNVPEPKVYSTKDFRPHGRSLFDPTLRLNVADDALIDDTTVWQRLSDYRIHNKVQLLTLWRSGASSVSLQAGKRGDPTLQWTSRLFNRGRATQGLLDRLFPISALGDNGNGVAHTIPRSSTPQPGGKGVTSLSALHSLATGVP